MTYRQLLKDVGLAVLLAVPTLALAAPGSELPTIRGVIDDKPAPAPLVAAAEQADRRG
jgi:hypothetical protein